MSAERPPMRLSIREIVVSAASPSEARRLADALPAALERAFSRVAPEPRRHARPADRVAAEIAQRVADASGRTP